MDTSEKILAGFIKDLPRDKVIISDKFTPQCANAASPTAMKDMIEMQLGLMGLDRFDIYWIHNSFHYHDLKFRCVPLCSFFLRA